jgi:hypothetical protein
MVTSLHGNDMYENIKFGQTTLGVSCNIAEIVSNGQLNCLNSIKRKYVDLDKTLKML